MERFGKIIIVFNYFFKNSILNLREVSAYVSSFKYEGFKFSKSYENEGKDSGEWKSHGLMATQGPTTAWPREEFLILKGLDRWKIHSRAFGLPPYINANMVNVRSLFCNLKE